MPSRRRSTLVIYTTFEPLSELPILSTAPGSSLSWSVAPTHNCHGSLEHRFEQEVSAYRFAEAPHIDRISPGLLLFPMSAALHLVHCQSVPCCGQGVSLSSLTPPILERRFFANVPFARSVLPHRAVMQKDASSKRFNVNPCMVRSTIALKALSHDDHHS